MSVNSNFKKDKCWSCEFFSGKREYKKGLFLGDSVYTDGHGKCTSKRSSNFNHDVDENKWCSKYQKWGVLQSALAIEEQKKETQRVMNELKRQQEEASRVSSYLEPRRELTAVEKVEIEREKELRRIRAEQEEKQRKINAIKRSPVVAGLVSGVITIFAFLLGWIPYWYWDYQVKTSRFAIEQLEELGHKPTEAIVQEFYQDGLHAKEMRGSIIWIPFVILLIGIGITVLLVIYLNKKKRIKLSNK